jgi:hypothetical protein
METEPEVCYAALADTAADFRRQEIKNLGGRLGQALLFKQIEYYRCLRPSPDYRSGMTVLRDLHLAPTVISRGSAASRGSSPSGGTFFEAVHRGRGAPLQCDIPAQAYACEMLRARRGGRH